MVNQGAFLFIKSLINEIYKHAKCHCMLVLVCVLLIIINNARYKLKSLKYFI